MLSQGCGLDWPLSRDEKKNRVIALYSQELDAASEFHCREAESEDSCKRIAQFSGRGCATSASRDDSRTRLSVASTADTECSASTQRNYRSRLDSGHGALDIASPASEDLLIAIQDAVESATLKVLTRYPSASSVADHVGLARSSSARFCSEEPRRSFSSTRNSRGFPHVQQKPNRRSLGSRTPRTHAVLEATISDDGEEGDTEIGSSRLEHQRAGRNGRRSWFQSRSFFNQQRSYSVPPEGKARPQIESLESFLGEQVPACPYCH